MKRAILATVALVALPLMASAQTTPPIPSQTAPGAPRPVARPGASARPEKPPADPNGPRIDIAEKIKDFGVVAKGDKITAVFEVANTGKQPLEISGVRPTCGCTVADFDRTIPPGGKGKIHAEVDTTSFLGPISKAVLVFSNDPTNPQLSVVIKADVRAYVEVRPRPILRFNALQGEPAVEKVTLVATDGSTFKVTGAETGGGPFRVAYRELGEKERLAGPNAQGSQWEVEVTVPPDAPEGLLNHKIEIKTTAAKAASVPISVTGVVRPIIQVIPPEINFGNVPGDAPIGRNLILVNNRQGAQLEVKGTEVDSPDFTVEVIPLEAGQRFQIAVSMPAGLSKGEHKGTVTIATSDPSRSTIKVPILATIQ